MTRRKQCGGPSSPPTRVAGADMPYVSPHNHDEGDTRVCRVCGERKLMTEFFFSNNKTSRRRICKTCVKRQREDRHQAEPSIRAAADRRALLKKYNLTEAAFELFWLWQAGRCAICFGPMKPPHIDHDHKTGKVRGLLCFDCNTGIGKLRDSVDRLRSAIRYLGG